MYVKLLLYQIDLPNSERNEQKLTYFMFSVHSHTHKGIIVLYSQVVIASVGQGLCSKQVS